MSKIDIEWDDKEFRKHLDYIRSQLTKEIESVIVKDGQEIVNIASSTAPKQYGFLRASIGKTNPSLITGSPKKAPELKGVWRLEKDDNGVSLEVGSGMKYARAMEYYREAYSVKTQKRKLIKMREGRSPYLAPAFLTVQPTVIKDLKDLIGKVLNAKG